MSASSQAGAVRWLMRRKWNLLRLVVAAVVVWFLLADTPGRLARLQLASLPGFDYAGEVQRLANRGRFGEAVLIADAGLDRLPAGSEEAKALLAARDGAIARRDSALRLVKDIGWGALTGTGDSLESLAGAITADMLVVGDVRDLLIQGTKYAVDGEADPIIAGLSAVGVATTVLPYADVPAAVLKIARKSGALTGKLAEQVLGAIKRGERLTAGGSGAAVGAGAGGVRRGGTLAAVAEDTAALARGASPGGAVRIMRQARDANELSAMAKFVERQGTGRVSNGAFALLTGGEPAAETVRAASRLDGPAQAAVERALIRAAHKGPRGMAWLAGPGARAAMRPHPILGLVKTLYKGNAEGLVSALADRLDPLGWWLLPLAAAWLTLEVVLVLRPRGRSGGGLAARTYLSPGGAEAGAAGTG